MDLVAKESPVTSHSKMLCRHYKFSDNTASQVVASLLDRLPRIMSIEMHARLWQWLQDATAGGIGSIWKL